MASQPLLEEPGRVEEPRDSPEFSDALTRVAADRRLVIVRRDGTDLAAVIPLEYLDLLREVLARQEVEGLAAGIDWNQALKASRPPQAWFDDDDNPFAPDALVRGTYRGLLGEVRGEA
jgi:hypothetical protein